MQQTLSRKVALLLFMTFFLFFSYLSVGSAFVPKTDFCTISSSIEKQVIPTELTWGIGWGTDDIDCAEDVWANEDGIYVCGTVHEDTENAKLMLTKFVQSYPDHGDLKWNVNWSLQTPTYGKAIWSNGTDIYTAADSEDKLILIKWNLNGSQLWNSTWDLRGNVGFLNDLWGTNDEIYACGTYMDDLLLIKWSAIDGVEIWNHTWGGLGAENANGIWGNETNIYTCGSTTSYGEGLNDTLIVRWESDGNQVWNETWGTEYDDEFYSSIWGYGSNLYVCGTIKNKSSSYNLFMSWNRNGGWIWKIITGRPERKNFANSIWANQYHVYFTGTIYLEESGYSKMYLLKLSYSGEREERYTWGSSGYNTTGESIFINGENLYICGRYAENSAQYILRYYSYPQIQPPTFLLVRPNPSPNGTYTIEWEKVPGADSYNLYRDNHPILDITNRAPYQSLNATKFTETNLGAGTYFYIITTVMNASESIMSFPYIVEVNLPFEIEKIPGFNLSVLLISMLICTGVGIYISKRKNEFKMSF